jgi:hypothetical protein
MINKDEKPQQKYDLKGKREDDSSPTIITSIKI